MNPQIIFYIFWVFIGVSFVGCCYRITDILQDKLARYLDQIDTLFHTQKMDRAEHRKSLNLIRDDLVVISSSVQEIRRIARTIEHKIH